MLKAKKDKKKLTIKQICAKPAHYVNSVVTLEGSFLGWGALGKHHFPPGAETSPKTRSDWMFATGLDCAYVTGGKPVGVDPAEHQDYGCHIELTGMVALGDDGGVYFVFRDGRRLVSKPVSTAKPAA
ncbi:MAG: hypothetical protein LAP21_17160 [Acidobacteriia bacterium]|nr:hypothetical protein [Terriglobia bacterium]